MITNRLVPVAVAGDPRCAIVADPDQLEDGYQDYFHDESRLEGGAVGSLALPCSAEQLVYVMARHHERGAPVTVSGGRTGVAGGATTPASGGHIVSTARIDCVGEVGTDEQGAPFVRVGAGTLLADLNQHLLDHHSGLFFPVDPSEPSATLGGMISTNASGPRSFRYGSMRGWVKWLRIVLVDGRVLELRRGQVRAADGELVLEGSGGVDTRVLRASAIPKPHTKNTIGYPFEPEIDSVDLFIGSEGTLGVVSDAELRLAPRPTSRLGYLQFFDSEATALDFVEWLRSEVAARFLPGGAPGRGAPLAIEFFDQGSLRLVARHLSSQHCRYAAMIDDSCQAAIYTELAMEDEAELEPAYEAIVDFLEPTGTPLERSGAATQEAELREMRILRHSVPEQVNNLIAGRKRANLRLHKVATDMAVPDAHLRSIYALYDETLRREGLEHFIFGHVGDNHLHVNIAPRSEEELERALGLYEDIGREVVRRGGAVSAEHGIGRIKRALLEIQYQPEHLQTMRDIKRLFDPRGLLNPGVLIDP